MTMTEEELIGWLAKFKNRIEKLEDEVALSIKDIQNITSLVNGKEKPTKIYLVEVDKMETGIEPKIEYISKQDGIIEIIKSNGEKTTIQGKLKLSWDGIHVESGDIEVDKAWKNTKEKVEYTATDNFINYIKHMNHRIDKLEKKVTSLTTQPLSAANPPFLVDANINGRYYETDSTSQLGATCNRYRFNRNARYVVFEIAMMSSKNSLESKALVVPVGSEEPIKSVSHFSNKESVYSFLVDLGVPDGSTFELDLKLKTYHQDNKAYCRVLRAYQTDVLGKDTGFKFNY